MFRLKSCPRCRGDLFIGRAADVGYEVCCLQCGYIAFEDSIPLPSIWQPPERGYQTVPDADGVLVVQRQKLQVA